MNTGVVGPGRGRAASGDRRFQVGRVDTAGPGVQGTSDPVVSRACGTWKTRQGPGTPKGVAGKPEVTKAQLPGGNRMPKKRMPVAERRRETQAAGPAPPAGGLA